MLYRTTDPSRPPAPGFYWYRWIGGAQYVCRVTSSRRVLLTERVSRDELDSASQMTWARFTDSFASEISREPIAEPLDGSAPNLATAGSRLKKVLGADKAVGCLRYLAYMLHQYVGDESVSAARLSDLAMRIDSGGDK